MSKINEAIQRPDAQTKGYEPIKSYWLRRHRNLPSLSFLMIEQVLLDETIQIGLAARRAVIQGVEFGFEINGQWQTGVQCADEAVGAWVMRQIRKLWACAIDHVSSAQVYGWCGMEVIWERSQEFQTWEISGFEQRHANDVRALIDTTTGRKCGIRFTNIKGVSEGYVDLRFPEAFFHAYDASPGEIYGRTVLTGAYRPWADKHLDGGAVDVRRLFMHKDAYGGADIKYPEGSTDIGTIDNPFEVANRELAREIVEQLEAGGVTTTPMQYDDEGRQKWELTRATVPSNPTHILQYPGDLDGEMLRGMYVPDGVLKADDTGSWQGRLIPMGILYANLDPWVGTLLRDFREQVLEPGIVNNWGRLVPFSVQHKPLAKQALEQQRQQQAPGMDPSMGGVDPTMGMDPSMMDPSQGDPNAMLEDPSQQPQMMGVSFDAAEAVGIGVLDAAGIVEAARIALADGPTRMAAMHAPKGYTDENPLVIDGNKYRGGQFIPGEVVAKASESQRQELESGKKAEPIEVPTKQKAKAPELVAGPKHDSWVSKIAASRGLTLKDGSKVKVNVERKAGKFVYTVRHYSADKKRTDYAETFGTEREAADFAAKLLHYHSTKPAAKPQAAPNKPKSQLGPLNERNFRYKSTKFFSSGLKAKYKDNIAALRILNELKEDDRAATPEEQEAISKFVGWGQMPGLFNDYYERYYDQKDDLSDEIRQLAESSGDEDRWKKERKELKELIGESGYEQARASVINGHYTHPDVIVKQWEMANRLGFTGGKMLEPAIGGGYYLGFMPKDLKSRTAITAVEKDSGSAAISQALYPDANVINRAFEDFKTPDDHFDLVATNVPFSGAIRISDPRYPGIRPTLHDYYFLRAAKTTKPGGLAMLITSAGTMDKLDPDVREEIEKDMEFVSAVRFPGGIHKENAGTEVVTDLIMLRKKGATPEDTPDATPSEAEPNKPGFTGVTVDSLGRLYHWRDGKRVPAPRWDDTVEVPDPNGGEPIRVNRYFADNPEQILGQLDRTGSLYSGNLKNVSITEDYDKMLEDAVKRLPENIVRTSQTKPASPNPEEEPDAIITADRHNEGETVIHDGKLYTYSRGGLLPHKATGKRAEAIMGMMAIRDKVRELIAAERAGKDSDGIRRDLNALYDAFVGKWGSLHEHASELQGDIDRPMLMSLETLDRATKGFRKADIFEHSTVRRAPKVTEAKTIEDALGVSLHDSAAIDVNRIAELLGKPVDDVASELSDKGLAFINPNGEKWEPASEYLSGTTREKLELAREAAKTDKRYEANVRALDAAQPEDIPIQDISLRLGSPWIHPSVFEAFVSDTLGYKARGRVDFDYNKAAGSWHVKVDSSIDESDAAGAWSITDDEYGDTIVSFSKILTAAMTNKPITVRTGPSEARVVDREKTEAAQAKIEELQDRFSEWAMGTPKVAAFLEKAYNESQNTIRERHFDGSHQTFPGMDEKYANRLYQIQKDFVWRVVSTGRGLAAHEVGTGKTTSMVAAAMECRRLGLAKKPAFAVLKANIEQFTREAQELYPEARILSTNDMFDSDKRQETLHRMATGDYDMIIMSHEHLQGMKLRKESEEAFVRDELKEIEAALVDAHANKAVTKGKKKIGDAIVKQLENRRDALLNRMAASQKEGDKDPIYFEDSGIDMLFVDEAHKFKSLPANTSRNYAGISKNESNRAMDMLFKCRWLQKQHNGRGVVFATGTPIANTMTELYNMQRYLQYDELKQRGLHVFDAWADTFGVTSNDLEFKVSGEVDRKQRFSKFVNVPELRLLASQFMDVQLADNLRKPDGSPAVRRPKKHEHLIIAEETPAVQRLAADIQERAKALKGVRHFEKGEDNHLTVMNDAKMGSMDPRLVYPGEEDEPNSKANKAVQNVLSIYHAHPGQAQAVFSDLGVHAGENRISLFEDMRDKLVKAGVPAHEIAILSDPSMSDKKKDVIAAKIRSGEIRIAFGSTQTLGTGMNVQERLKAIHHLDIPYVPAALEQRNGRAWRSGNTNTDIDVFKYTTHGSADPVFWQILARKSNFIHQFMAGKAGREMEDLDAGELSPDELVAVATGDPRRIQRIEAEQDYYKLRRAKTRHGADQARMRQLLAGGPQRETELARDVEDFERDSQHFDSQNEFDYVVPHLKAKDNWRAVEPYKDPKSTKVRAEAEKALEETIAHYSDPDVYYSMMDRSQGLPLAKIKGFNVRLMEDGKITVQGPSGRIQYAQQNTLASIEAAIRRVKKRQEEATQALQQHRDTMQHFERELAKPFQMQGKLDAARKRFLDLKVALGETVEEDE